jgi:uncharacterized glyoxalase superfamily protein PhnB
MEDTPPRWLASRVARPAADLARSVAFYRDLLGLPVTGGFADHDGYDGVFFALPGGGELELTTGPVAPQPGTDEDLLVLYLGSPAEITEVAARLTAAGVVSVPSRNPYWQRWAREFLDPDGYRVLVAATHDAAEPPDPVARCPSVVVMSEADSGSVWPILHYDDTHAALRFLVDVVGFREVVVAHGAGGELAHAELRWPGGGSLVFGWTGHRDGVHGGIPGGSSAVYIATDAVDEIHQRVARAGAEVVQPPHRTTFGSGAEAYACSARDPEGNLWTFGTYRGPSGAPPASARG